MAEVLINKLRSIEYENKSNEKLIDCILYEVERQQHWVFRPILRLLFDMIILLIVFNGLLFRLIKRNYYICIILITTYIMYKFFMYILLLYNDCS
ncbi:hypothetical protein [Swinepox virus]|uniref:Uncharacterized protein n=1 Tax=Swinepox virus TaxID=10276 RepID=A0A881SY35_SWPV|nr:hypothetical protein [Swinepox virus]